MNPLINVGPLLTGGALNGQTIATLLAKGIMSTDQIPLLVDRRAGWSEFEDFVLGSSSLSASLWLTFSSGAILAVASPDGTQKEIGAFGINCDALNDVGTVYKGTQGLNLDSGTAFLEWRAKVTTLSTAGEVALVSVGGGDQITSTEITDGVYWYYDFTNNADKWSVKTASNGVRTEAVLDGTLGEPDVDVDTSYHRLGIVATNTQVDFYYDGVLQTSITTNIPSGASRVFGPLIKEHKSVQTAAVSKNVTFDYFQGAFILDASR